MKTMNVVKTAAWIALFAGIAAAGIKYVAVVETEVDIHSGASAKLTKAEVRLVTAELRREAVNNLPRDKYNIMTSETVMAQGSAKLEECAEENCVIALGSKIGADYIVRGVISRLQTRFTLTVEIYETENGNLVASSEPVRSENAGELIEKAAAACANMYRRFADEQGSALQAKPRPSATYTVTVNINPTNGGYVSRSPIKAAYDAGEIVALTAAPYEGYTFSGWSGSSNSANATLRGPITGDLTLTANFQAYTPTPSEPAYDGGYAAGSLTQAAGFAESRVEPQSAPSEPEPDLIRIARTLDRRRSIELNSYIYYNKMGLSNVYDEDRYGSYYSSYSNNDPAPYSSSSSGLLIGLQLRTDLTYVYFDIADFAMAMGDDKAIFLNSQLLAKYPIYVSFLRISPLAGVSTNMSLDDYTNVSHSAFLTTVGGRIDAELAGAFYASTEYLYSFGDATAQSLKIGCGLHLGVGRSYYTRMELRYHYTRNAYEQVYNYNGVSSDLGDMALTKHSIGLYVGHGWSLGKDSHKAPPSQQRSPQVQTRRYVGNIETFTDSRDGTTYKVVTIGGRRWMAENLKITSGRSWSFDNGSSSATDYGRLYDWETAKSVCPSGWHLPTRDEWGDLARAAGGQGAYGAGGKAGAALKAGSGWNRNLWGKDGNGTDDYGFSAVPAGIYFTGVGAGGGMLFGTGIIGSWWTATGPGRGDKAYVRLMNNERAVVFDQRIRRDFGVSVRCIQD